MECGCLQNPAPPLRELCHRLYIVTSDRPLEIYAGMSAAQTGLVLDIQLLEEDASVFGRLTELHGRKLNETVDIDLIKKWIGLCETEHGTVCDSVWWRSGEETLPNSMRVVDVINMSVVPTPTTCCYVALSYLWGGAGEEYWTAQANIHQRSVPGGLDISILPGTIVDSILLVRQLGEQYLWVDALCIIQDDPEDKAIQIHTMELIYGSSFLTIFAVGGTTAYAPLPGLRPGTRTPHQHTEVIKDLHLAVPLPILRETLAKSAWDTRGWTYQELMLSRRRIYFTNQQVYFECGQDVWCEDVIAESTRRPRSHHPLRYTGGGGFTFLSAPPRWAKNDYIQHYTSAIARYTQRQLTVESDIVDAITALTNAMTKGFKLGGGDPGKAFMYGVSVTDLNHALLWQPNADISHSRRLIDGNSRWPSWSWAGWRGAVCYTSTDQYMNIHSSVDRPRPIETLVGSWYIVYDSRGKIIQLDVRHIHRAIAYPEDEVGLERYAPPQGAVDLQLLSHTKLEPGTLIFRTTSAYFLVARIDDKASIGLHHAIFAILSSDTSSPPSARIGRIILPLSTPSPSSFEFIVLSRTNGASGLYDEAVFGERHSGCFLYVMALQKAWKDDMPGTETKERVGVGVVLEKAWIELMEGETMVLLR